MKRPDLPKDFIIGSATASYQVEGRGGRKSDTIWDDFAKIPGKVWCGENGDVASDQIHRMKQDVSLMAQLGLKAYRFSVSWPRVLPYGGEEVDKEGIQYYKDLCDELHKYGIKACLTMYHWDLPSEIQEKGGWANRETAYLFQKYAETLYRELGDRVDMWITLNEPFCICFLGYGIGIHAPGIADKKQFASSVHYTNLAHGLAVQSYRRTSLKAPIGIVWNPVLSRNATDSKEDKEAALRSRAIKSEIYMGPVLKKSYPDIVTKDMGISFPVEDGDMEIIGSKIDFYGINYYNERPVMKDDSALGFRDAESWEEVTTGIHWPIVEEGLVRLLRWSDEYSGHLPVYITENGSAEEDVLESDGRIHDMKRIQYYSKHLGAAERVIKEGVPLKGYFCWSFIDNYEWTYGYTKRFGLIYCDYQDLSRIPKDSAYYIRDIIAGYGEI